MTRTLVVYELVPTVAPRPSNLLLLQCRRERLSELVGFVLILDHECVEVAAASDLKLGLHATAFNLHRLGILAASHLQKLPDLRDLLRHCILHEPEVIARMPSPRS